MSDRCRWCDGEFIKGENGEWSCWEPGCTRANELQPVVDELEKYLATLREKGKANMVPVVNAYKQFKGSKYGK